MARYIKVLVPDDFNDEKDLIILNTNEYEQAASIWEPVYTDVLDYGFIGLVDFMGDDNAIVNAARVSYGKGTKASSSDENLLRYLMRHKHSTPTEMVEFKFHIKAPLFVMRQIHRHRTFSLNEESARYSEMTDEMYVPDNLSIAPQSTDNKQGRTNQQFDSRIVHAVQEAIQEALLLSYDTYKYLLPPKDGEDKILPDWLNNRKLSLQEIAVNSMAKIRNANPGVEYTEADLEAKFQEIYEANEFTMLSDDFPGIARELARIVMPLATYSQMYWKGNLHNILHFISLRANPHAQKEIRVYADAMLELIKPIVPWTVKAFIDYEMNGYHLSRMEIDVMKEVLSDLDKDSLTKSLTTAGLGKREVTEFLTKFKG